MLRQLTVRNFALVEALDLAFAPGLTVITGESGAGKSILLNALELVLGARAASAAIRPGATACEVTAEFDLGAHPGARDYLAEQALVDPTDAGQCLVRRVAGQGRSRAFVNGSPVNLAALQALCNPLIEVHGQHAHRSLLDRTVQLALLDDYAGAAELAGSVGAAFRAWRARCLELEHARERAQAAEQRLDLLRYQVAELRDLAPVEGEFEELETRRRRLAAAGEIRATVGAHLSELEDGLIARLSRMSADLDAIDDAHAALSASRERMRAAQVEAEEALGEMRDYFDAVPEDAAALDEVERRLDAIHDIARKHRVRAGNLPAHAADIEAELDALAADGERVDALAEAVETAATAYRDLAGRLSTERTAAAEGFAADVGAVLAELRLEGAALELAFTATENERGLESVEYRVTTNPRYPPAPLATVASGGELTRIALAIEVVAAQRSALPCLVLDEADVGLGGTTADILGRMLRRLARHTQVICVTHAPQVAALGDAHLLVKKTADQDTVIVPLGDAERVEELSRMLAGRRITAETRAYARTLLDGVQGPG
ncbi:MAG: DNA repair protein RecN [Gammaproteobacteria bacterium]|nr:DNA repair protein RecN [Gammaproteobacteria bacterium]